MSPPSLIMLLYSLDVNECNQGQPCDPVTSKSCENLPGDYKCICKDGYQNSNPKKCISKNPLDNRLEILMKSFSSERKNVCKNTP